MKFSFNYLCILIFAMASLTGCSQTKNKMKVSLNDLDGTIINKQQEIENATTLDNVDGTIIAGNGSFNVQKNAKLTINSKLSILHNKQLFFGEGAFEFLSGSVEQLNVVWFGATPNDNSSDTNAIQKAITTAIMSEGVSVVYFPPGEYVIDKPLLALRKNTKGYTFYNLTLKGHQLAYNNPGGNKGGVSVIKVTNEIPFALGIQAARGVHIENMVFDGYIKEKTPIEELIYKPSNEIYQQQRFTPLAAIVIDPFGSNPPKEGGYKGLEEYYGNARGSSRVHIEGSVIENFPTGIAISPNGETKQGDSVAITYTRFLNLVHGIVMCQAQSRNVVVDNCSFHRIKFAFNSDDFGEQQGILPEVNNIKVADGVAWLYKANGNVAYGHFRNVYAESLYGIGYSVINKQPLDFHGCVFKFRPISDPLKVGYNPSILTADNASFTGCTFTFGGGSKNVEPLVMNIKEATFINCYFDTSPINIGNNLNKKNTFQDLNSNLRKSKIKTNNWAPIAFNEEKQVQVQYDSKTQYYYFKNMYGYTIGDYVFGLAALKDEPFEGKSIYTVLGKVEKMKNNNVFFTSKLLEKKNTKLRIVVK